MSNFGEIRLDFHVFDTGEPTRLLVADFSEWKVIKNLPASMDITVPGCDEPITLPFQKGNFQSYTSLSLGLSQPEDCKKNITDLPDGMYEFCLRGGAYGKRQKHRYYLKMDKLSLKVKEAWINLGLEYKTISKEKIDGLIYIQGYLESAKANTEDGNINNAMDLYNMAKDRLSEYLNCKECV